MKYHKLRRLLHPLSRTPLHPQWLMARNGNSRFFLAAKYAEGIVLDIGCSGQKLERFLSPEETYIGMDFLCTASGMYGTSPAVYGDAQHLPFQENSIDTISLLEVLEHLPSPYHCICEMYRVLKPGGCLILSVPFLYPIHDAPYDYQRYTIYGLRTLAEKSNFAIAYEVASGHPVTTAMLLCNLALVKTSLDGFKHKRPQALLLLLLPVIIPLLNISGWLFDKIGSRGTFMSLGYTMILKRM